MGGYKANDAIVPEDGCNTITVMCLKASRRLPLNAPCLSLRMHQNMPQEVRGIIFSSCNKFPCFVCAVTIPRFNGQDEDNNSDYIWWLGNGDDNLVIEVTEIVNVQFSEIKHLTSYRGKQFLYLSGASFWNFLLRFHFLYLVIPQDKQKLPVIFLTCQTYLVLLRFFKRQLRQFSVAVPIRFFYTMGTW